MTIHIKYQDSGMTSQQGNHSSIFNSKVVAQENTCHSELSNELAEVLCNDTARFEGTVALQCLIQLDVVTSKSN